MDKKLTFSGGEPDINWDDNNRDENANRDALFGIMDAFKIGTNENFIISGCVATLDTGVDVDVTAGYIFLNGEILEVEAQTVVDGGTVDLYKYTKVTTYDVNGDKTFNDNNSRQTWQKNRGVVVAATTPILGTELDVVDGDRLTDKIVQFVTGEKINIKIIDIGDWNMDTAQTASVNHGITDWKKIRDINAIIRNDADDTYYNLGTVVVASGNASGAVSYVSSTIVRLNRTDSPGIFDGVNFDSTSYNRGWIIITYTD